MPVTGTVSTTAARVIPRGPHAYDAGSILGLSSIPVIADDQMWLYYTAMTTTARRGLAGEENEHRPGGLAAGRHGFVGSPGRRGTVADGAAGVRRPAADRQRGRLAGTADCRIAGPGRTALAGATGPMTACRFAPTACATKSNGPTARGLPDKTPISIRFRLRNARHLFLFFSLTAS